MLNNHAIFKKLPQTIGIVAPSFFIEKNHNFSVAIKYLYDSGFKLKFGATTNNKSFNTTGSPIQRAIDINRMYADSSVDIIIATDGGCKAIEVLEYLDFELIKNNPKPICGFSDITHILLAVYSISSSPAIHGMDLINGFGQEDSIIKLRNMELFWNIVANNLTHMTFENARILKSGEGVGVAIGGWLNAIHNLIGTEYFPMKDKIILFWEAVDEEPNRINMMLHSLRLSGLFDHLTGMVVGKLCNCIEKEYYDCIPTIEDIILNACIGYKFPIIIGAPFGHGEEKSSFRLGTKIRISTEDIK